MTAPCWISSVGRAVVSYTTGHQFDSDIQLHRQLARQDVNKAGIWHSSSMGEPSASEGYMQTKRLRCWFKSNLCHTSGISAVGSALALGARCREFESPISDQQKQVVLSKTTCFCNFLPYLPHHYLPSTLTISPDYLSQEDSFFNVERAA